MALPHSAGKSPHLGMYASGQNGIYNGIQRCETRRSVVVHIATVASLLLLLVFPYNLGVLYGIHLLGLSMLFFFLRSECFRSVRDREAYSAVRNILYIYWVCSVKGILVQSIYIFKIFPGIYRITI